MCFLWWTTQRETCCMLGAELFNSVKEKELTVKKKNQIAKFYIDMRNNVIKEKYFAQCYR
jgi:hypothetical protein